MIEILTWTRLLGLSEIEREDILAQRQEEMQRIKMRSQLDQMVKDQSGRKDDTISKSAKRMTLFSSYSLGNWY